MELFDSFPYQCPSPLTSSQRNDCLLRLYANQIILNHWLPRDTWLYESMRVRRTSYNRKESLLLKNFCRSDALIRRFRTLIYFRSRCPAWETIDRRMTWTKEYSRRIRLAALYLKDLHLDVKHDLAQPSCCRQIRFSGSRTFYLQTNRNQRDSYSCSYISPPSRQIFLKVSGSTDMPPLTNSLSFIRTANIRRFISRTSWTKEKSKLQQDRYCYSGARPNFEWHSRELVFQPFIEYTKRHENDRSHIIQRYINALRYGAFLGRHGWWPTYLNYFPSARRTGIHGQAIRAVWRHHHCSFLSRAKNNWTEKSTCDRHTSNERNQIHWKIQQRSLCEICLREDSSTIRLESREANESCAVEKNSKANTMKEDFHWLQPWWSSTRWYSSARDTNAASDYAATLR
jgi:hypothetical protein